MIAAPWPAQWPGRAAKRAVHAQGGVCEFATGRERQPFLVLANPARFIMMPSTDDRPFAGCGSVLRLRAAWGFWTVEIGWYALGGVIGAR
jgi:hypothetical protein